MAKIAGFKWVLKLGTDAGSVNEIAGQRGLSLDYSKNLVDVTSKDGSHTSRQYIAGIDEWSAELDCVFSSEATGDGKPVPEIIDKAIAGTEISLDANDETSKYTGTCLCENFKLDGSMDTEMSFSASLKGTGALTRATIE